MTKSELHKIRNQFLSNKKAIERLKQRIEIIEAEEQALLKLISEVKETETPQTLLEIRTQKAIQKRNNQFK